MQAQGQAIIITSDTCVRTCLRYWRHSSLLYHQHHAVPAPWVAEWRCGVAHPSRTLHPLWRNVGTFWAPGGCRWKPTQRQVQMVGSHSSAVTAAAGSLRRLTYKQNISDATYQQQSVQLAITSGWTTGNAHWDYWVMCLVYRSSCDGRSPIKLCADLHISHQPATLNITTATDRCNFTPEKFRRHCEHTEYTLHNTGSTVWWLQTAFPDLAVASHWALA
jgi:hypothetical protein